MTEEKQRMLNGAIAYLRFKGFHEIKAPFKEFDTPQVVYKKEQTKGFKPDLIARKDYGTYIFQVVENPEDQDFEKQQQRWEIFEDYAKRKKGKFYLITYSDQAEDLSNRINKTHIEAGLIKIRK